ncbi:MAG: hypothetical protein IJR13_06880 [Bacteroidales bacterium]|nr:hypothetical protein [Bacteroidales bacterium]
MTDLKSKRKKIIASVAAGTFSGTAAGQTLTGDDDSILQDIDNVVDDVPRKKLSTNEGHHEGASDSLLRQIEDNDVAIEGDEEIMLHVEVASDEDLAELAHEGMGGDEVIGPDDEVRLNINRPAEMESRLREVEQNDDAIGADDEVRLNVNRPAEMESRLREVEQNDDVIGADDEVQLNVNRPAEMESRLREVEQNDDAIEADDEVQLNINRPAEMEAKLRDIEQDDVAIDPSEEIQLDIDVIADNDAKIQQLEDNDVAISGDEVVELEIAAPLQAEDSYVDSNDYVDMELAGASVEKADEANNDDIIEVEVHDDAIDVVAVGQTHPEDMQGNESDVRVASIKPLGMVGEVHTDIDDVDTSAYDTTVDTSFGSSEADFMNDGNIDSFIQ